MKLGPAWFTRDLLVALLALSGIAAFLILREATTLSPWLEELGEPHVQNWLKVEIPKLEGQMIAMPTRDDVQIPVEENLIVELCSR